MHRNMHCGGKQIHNFFSSLAGTRVCELAVEGYTVSLPTTTSEAVSRGGRSYFPGQSVWDFLGMMSQ